jgi:hypothetical protein
MNICIVVAIFVRAQKKKHTSGLKLNADDKGYVEHDFQRGPTATGSGMHVPVIAEMAVRRPLKLR